MRPDLRQVKRVEGTAGGSAGHSQNGYAGCPRSPAEVVGRQIGEVNLYTLY